MTYPHLFGRLYNTPLLLLPEKARVIEAVFRAHLTGPSVPVAAGDVPVASAPKPLAAAGLARAENKPYAMTDSGIAVIPVMGTLVQRASGLDAMSGIMSYARVGGLFRAAIEDSDVSAVLLEVDSPGGEVYGLFDLVDRIYAGGAVKPVWAAANEAAYSAAYAIASATQRLTLPRTAGVGSVGVIAMHVDQSKRDASQGFVYTPVFAGAKKNDGTSHAPLSASAQKDLQAEVDRLYEIFVSAVARDRGIDAKVVRETEAAVLNPDQAIALGMADEVASFSDTLGMLEEHLVARSQTVFLPAASQAVNPQEYMMEHGNNAPGSGAQASTAALEAAAQVRGHTAGLAEGVKQGAEAERARIGGILRHAEAESRGKQAIAMALDTDLSVDAAGKLLAASPKESAPVHDPLAAAMAGVPNPKTAAVPGAEVGDDNAKVQALAAQIINAGKAGALAA